MKLTEQIVQKAMDKMPFKSPYTASEWLENLYLENYHCHKDFSNVVVTDCAESIENYAKRIKELGSGQCLYSGEHGSQGNQFHVYKVAEQYGLKYRHSAEVYWVKDRHQKDRANCHMMIIAKNPEGRKDLNYILSIANEDGYYYQPRIDLELLFSVNPENFIVTSACLAGHKYEDADEVWLSIANHFKGNFFFEVQNHNTQRQKELNQHLLELSKKHNIPIICGLDSHYVLEENRIKRELMQKDKGIEFNEEEANWYLDYPDTMTVIERFEKQGVLNQEQILEAILNTNVFVNECEEINFNREFKIPNIYKDLDYEGRVNLFKKKINEKYKQDPYKSKEKIQGIRWEVDQFVESKTVDYPLFSEAMVRVAVDEFGGTITKTARGCFTKEAMVLTKAGFKTIDQVLVGDEVIGADGDWHKVLQTHNYEIQEDLIEFSYDKEGSIRTKYPLMCTKDHKILTYSPSGPVYKKAEDLTLFDFVCCPKMNNPKNETIVYDLAQYINEDSSYDEEWIYEYKKINKPYLYSPNDIERKTGISNSFVGKVLRGYTPKKGHGVTLLNELMEFAPFKNIEQYREYYSKHSYTVSKIPRFLKLDNLMNAFIGLMYGDGWTRHGYIGLAINSTTKKWFNRYVFERVAERFGCNVSVKPAKNGKNLTQLYIYCPLLTNWFKDQFFESRQARTKIFNPVLFNQSKDKMHWLQIGLIRSDGSTKSSRNSSCFDNTSLSILGAYSILNNLSNPYRTPLALDVRLAHSWGGYNMQESYKLRHPLNGFVRPEYQVREDNNYFYMLVHDIQIHKDVKTTVYDLTIENEHSYVINNIVVHNSASSFITNNYMGLTTIDRFTSDVPLFPERFLTKERILSGQSPDIDSNISQQEPFVSAIRQLLGEHGCYPLMTRSTYKEKSAWLMYARVNGIEAEKSFAVSKALDQYNKDLRYADDEDKDQIRVEDYIPVEYAELYEESKSYQGTTVAVGIHACGHLCFDGDIRREIGLISAKSETTGKRTLVACVEGQHLDEFGYVKEDLLIVDAVSLTKEMFDSIGKPVPSFETLKKMVDGDQATWDIYKNGITCCVNQMEKEATAKKAMKYAPQNIAELCAFIAAIRPSFASLLNNFINRKPYTTGEEKIDKILESSSHYMLYQESIMAVLSFLGLPMGETYSVIKSISKKKLKGEKKANLLKELQESWFKEFGNLDNFEKVWKVIEDAAAYAFNSSHSYAMAGDSLYLAWFKAHHPAKFYEVAINHYQKKGNKNKIDALIKEAMKFYGYKIGAYEFGADNRQVNIQEEEKVIYPNLSAVKGFGEKVVKQLYEVGQSEFSDFSSVYSSISETALNKTQMANLAKLGYFSKYGNENQILALIKLYDFIAETKSSVSKKKLEENSIPLEMVIPFGRETKTRIMDLDKEALLKVLESQVKEDEPTDYQKLYWQWKITGIADKQFDSIPMNELLVTNVQANKGSAKVRLYSSNRGKSIEVKIQAKKFEAVPLEEGNFIRLEEIKRQIKKEFTGKILDNGKREYLPVPSGETEPWAIKYTVLDKAQ